MIEVSTEYISCFDMIQEYDKCPLLHALKGNKR